MYSFVNKHTGLLEFERPRSHAPNVPLKHPWDTSLTSSFGLCILRTKSFRTTQKQPGCVMSAESVSEVWSRDFPKKHVPRMRPASQSVGAVSLHCHRTLTVVALEMLVDNRSSSAQREPCKYSKEPGHCVRLGPQEHTDTSRPPDGRRYGQKVGRS